MIKLSQPNKVEPSHIVRCSVQRVSHRPTQASLIARPCSTQNRAGISAKTIEIHPAPPRGPKAGAVSSHHTRTAATAPIRQPALSRSLATSH
jgi:hypothetical protein